jgi:two-component system, NarL family, sensor histidine kinase UhpB
MKPGIIFRRTMPFAWRIFVVNAALLVVAAVALAFSPATVSFPIALTEGIVLTVGLVAILLVNLLLVRRSFAPLERLTRLMRRVDLLQPGQRVDVSGPNEVRELGAVFNEMLDRLERERHESGWDALKAQEEERRRVAQELHDEVGQALTAAMLRLEGAEVEEAREGLRQALEEVREIAGRLRPEALDDLGLRNALRGLVANMARSARLDLSPDIEASLPPLTAEQELVVYRVAQEALTNAVRHSGAETVRFSLTSEAGEVVLAVEDDGQGFENGPAAVGSGIRGMRERALLVRARLEVESTPGQGTAVRLRVPA